MGSAERGPVRLGIDIGGTKIAAGLLDAAGELVGNNRSVAQPELAAPEMVAAIGDQIAQLLRAHGVEAGDLTAVGIGFPGDFDPLTGDLKSAPNLPRFVGHRPAALFREMLRERFGVEPVVAAGNDASAAALAEAGCGAGRGAGRLLYLTVSTGVGGARYDGETAINIEPGLRLFPDPQQPQVNLEDLASGTAIARAARRRIREELASGGEQALSRWFRLLDRVGGDGAPASRIDGLTARHLGEAVAAGEPACRELFESSARYVAIGLSQLLAQGFGEEKLIFGGSVAEKVPGYLDRVRHHLGLLQAESGVSPGLRRLDLERDLVVSDLGNRRGILGAVLLTERPKTG